MYNLSKFVSINNEAHTSILAAPKCFYVKYLCRLIMKMKLKGKEKRRINIERGEGFFGDGNGGDGGGRLLIIICARFFLSLIFSPSLPSCPSFCPLSAAHHVCCTIFGWLAGLPAEAGDNNKSKISVRSAICHGFDGKREEGRVNLVRFGGKCGRRWR